jgi:hypothetical protein
VVLVTILNLLVLLLNRIVIDVHPVTIARLMEALRTLRILLMPPAGFTVVLLATIVVLVLLTPSKPCVVVDTTVHKVQLLNFFAKLVTISQALASLLA